MTKQERAQIERTLMELYGDESRVHECADYATRTLMRVLATLDASQTPKTQRELRSAA